ncbi:hypothetical protein TraAM80_01254 [Trypanosoma rangeli]|uniref:Uncharacterized protein n=1 Tax=Trypanosoma rangeli TaxID=5698 RepID=A0A3R7NSC6_TRYRA|nr:uncharacterized protein TraAM80_01254 [Trypanosoma rangeli]RNF10870.1 hypothetical protein TraAM80_01254 [Trypanosoma rangeli]|eukprot:RNF10870.1 hypothetical protein TraAM80_01254 [Trypanosoma rangeli]
MVLVFSVLNREEGRSVDRRHERYQFSSFNGNVAVFYDSRHGPPEAEVACAANQDLSLEEASAHPFFVCSFDAFMDAKKEDSSSTNSTEQDVLEVLMSDVSARVAARENVTVVNRGAHADQFVERILRSLQKCIEQAAENAMQFVADELAKEKQMQRLLQLEHESNMCMVKESVKNTNETARPPPAGLKISAKLSQNLKRLRKQKLYILVSGQKAKERFTILTSAHHGELVPPCVRGSYLSPESFAALPPMRITYSGPGSRRTKTTTPNSSYHGLRTRRRSTMSILEILGEATGGEAVEPLKGNGWGKEMNYYVFDGSTSLLGLPGIPKFEDVIKGFSVDFWFRMDSAEVYEKRVLIHIMDGPRADLGQLFQISLKHNEHTYETICIYVRDSTNRVLECLMPLKSNIFLTEDGPCFHHFLLNVQSLEEGSLECLFDGQPATLQIVQQEYPIYFNAWPHRLFVGGYMDESNMPKCVFHGVICELRFGVNTADGPTTIVRWPLLADGEKLMEMMHTIPAEHDETLLNLERQAGPPPITSPFLDGNLVVNLGTLGVLGELLCNWRLEIRFRTNVSNRTMSLLGVTDRKCRMQELGIVMNAEPVFEKERFRYHEFNITLYLVDAFGACCSALLRGSEHQNAMDGQWHTLVWKCIDSEANTYRVKLDGVAQELLYLVREGPRRFVPFGDWVCLGGHNTRNHEVRRLFYGEIGRFFISVRGVPLATLNMDEGPGAYVLQDTSGRHHHGLLINPVTNAIRRHDVYWFPYPEEAIHDKGSINEEDGIIIYKNNNVSVAAVVFTCEFDTVGVAREVMYDILGETCVEPQVVANHISDKRPQWKTWRALPDSCFRPISTLVQLEETVNSTLSCEKPLGHYMFVIRIGDCHVTLLNLHGPVLPQGATYNYNVLKWQYAYAISGTKGRRELSLNRMIQGVESVLLRDTLTPFMTKKLGPLNVHQDSIVTEDIIRSMQNSGRPWFLSAVLHNHLLNAEYGSHLHIIHHFMDRMTADEAASVALFNRRLYNTTKEGASVVIQRNWRGREARLEAMRLRYEKEIRERRVEEINALRLNPLLKAKETLTALLVTLHQIDCEGISPITDDINDLSAALTKNGYEVKYLPNASRAALMKALSELDENTSSFVYISGYGGLMSVRQPLLFSLHGLHISITEGAQRAALDEERGREYRRILQDFREEYPPQKVRKGMRKASRAPPSKKALQEAELAARQREELFRMAVAELEKEEASTREASEEEYDTEVLMLIREIKLAAEATTEYERTYKKDPRGMHFVLPCEAQLIEPYANTVCSVEELISIALQRQLPSLGLQRIVALDLEPITPMSCGSAWVASSTGHTLKFVYQPQQRRIMSKFLRGAFEGRLPCVPAHYRYAVLKGGIETKPDERDWRSFATYLVSKMSSVCNKELIAELWEELDREVPFRAELIPVRGIVLDPEARDKLRREGEKKEVNVILRYGVGSSHVQADMFSVFKSIIPSGVTLKEITFKNTIYFLFTHCNSGIDGLVMESLLKEIERCRPVGCDVPISVSITAWGVRLLFDSKDPEKKMYISQWSNVIVVWSLSWQIPVKPVFGYCMREVDHVEYLYEVKVSCSLRNFNRLRKLQHTQPLPMSYSRYLACELVPGAS